MFNLMIGLTLAVMIIGPAVLASIENSWSRERDY